MASNEVPASAPAEPAWLTKARSYIGFHEQSGNRGLQEFIDLAHIGAEGDPWCSIFANAMLASVGLSGTGSALARSFERSPNFIKLGKPILGCIVTMWRGSPGSGQGHVTFYTGEQGGKIQGLGGNQNDQVCIEPFPDDARITGYWWPKSVPLPGEATIIAPTSAGTLFTGITATVFGGPGDRQGTTAYSDIAVGWPDRPGVALPFHFFGPRPLVRITYAGKSVVAPVVDVGPWNTNDPYWERNARPQAETGTDTRGRHTNLAGIDLTPATAAAIGLPGKGVVDWQFASETPMTEPAKPAPTPSPIAPAAPAAAQPVDLAPLVQALVPVLRDHLVPTLAAAAKNPATATLFEGLFGIIGKYLPHIAGTGLTGVIASMGLGVLGTTTPAGIISLAGAALPLVITFAQALSNAASRKP
jgi:uncharacterized protein (TIGR02594 family)